MNKPELLLKRLDEIGMSLAKKQDALALIGLGSVGKELSRLDPYSDLDFFVIVREGSKTHYLDDLGWLSEVAPVAYYFANTIDGYKLLYEDGVFCEFAVFTEDELKQAAFTPGRVIWKAKDISDEIAIPQRPNIKKQGPSKEWLVGEAMTNLYVGLCRDRRGEKLSAMQFIQFFAVERILQLSETVESATPTNEDPFNLERRYEQRFPAMAKVLPDLLQGYERNRESALAALAYLDQNFEINPAMKKAILELCDSA